MTGAFAGRNVGEVFSVVSAVAEFICEDGTAYAACVYEALLDSNPAQKESPLTVHQSLRDQRNGIDNRARCERGVDGKPGLQMARFGAHYLPFYFDGTKCFFELHPITEAEEHSLPRISLTDGSVANKPLARLHLSRRPVTTGRIPTNGRGVWVLHPITLLQRLCPRQHNWFRQSNRRHAR